MVKSAAPVSGGAANRGRPNTGRAKSANERDKERNDALEGAGGRVLSKVRLSAPATAALGILTELHGNNRKAIEEALLNDAKNLKRKSTRKAGG